MNMAEAVEYCSRIDFIENITPILSCPYYDTKNPTHVNMMLNDQGRVGLSDIDVPSTMI